MSIPLKAFVPANVLPDLRRARSGRVPRKRMRSIAVLFVDIEGCTRRCEDLPPHAMNDVIETYFSRYLDAVRAFEGEVMEPAVPLRTLPRDYARLRTEDKP